MSRAAAEVVRDPADVLVSARVAVDHAQADPSASLDTALRILERGDIDAETAATASWAAGLAARELNRLDVADEHLSRAMVTATAADLPELAARARSSRSLVLAYLGRTDEALLELGLAEPHLSTTEAARVQMQRGLILQRTGRLEEALDAYHRALPGLVGGGDRLAEVRLRVNRAVARTYRNELAAAEADLLRARVLAADLAQPLQVAACAHNLAFLYGRRGDVPRALAWFDRAGEEYRPLAVDAGLAAVLLSDRAEVLLNAGLAAEACTCAEQALAVLERSDKRVDQA
ncbi:MAG TPA: tetratricopeptide repeat protein [Acidimicrobiales bacterium]|nr:tetratricopeptide repeat protein [Acidimicrobiales bacterium]